MKTRFRVLVILILCLMVISEVNAAQASGYHKKKPTPIKNPHHTAKDIVVTFTEATYADLDNDGQADDINLQFTLVLSGYSEGELASGVTFKFIIDVITPSNSHYHDRFKYTTNVAEMLFVLDMLDHATDQGWYFANVRVFDQGNNFVSARDRIVFDPPGGKPGGDPRLLIVVVLVGTGRVVKIL